MDGWLPSNLDVDVEQKIGQAARTIGPGDQFSGQSWSDALLTMQLALVHTVHVHVIYI
jgi:hypothetical protein